MENSEGTAGSELGCGSANAVIGTVVLCGNITREIIVLSVQCSLVAVRTSLGFNTSSLPTDQLRNVNISTKAFTCNLYAAEKYFDTVTL